MLHPDSSGECLVLLYVSSGERLAADVPMCSAFALCCTSQCTPESISLPLLLTYVERTC